MDIIIPTDNIPDTAGIQVLRLFSGSFIDKYKELLNINTIEKKKIIINLERVKILTKGLILIFN